MGYSGHSPLRRSRSFFKERRPRVAQKIKKLEHAGESAFLSRFFLITSFSKAHYTSKRRRKRTMLLIKKKLFRSHDDDDKTIMMMMMKRTTTTRKDDDV